MTLRGGRRRAVLAGCVLIGLAGCDAYGPTPPEKPAQERALLELNGPPPTGILAEAEWKEMPPASQSRFEVSGARIGSAAYIVGGIDEGTTVPTATLERYDLTTGASALLSPLPRALDHLTVVTYEGNLYVAGGTSGAIGPNQTMHDTFFRYDVASDRWSAMPNLPEPRGAGVGGVIGSKFYLTGGAVAVPGDELSFTTLSSTDVFDFTTGTWSDGPDALVPRTHAAAVTVDDQLYVLGGTSGGGPTSPALSSGERFDPSTNAWTPIPDMPGRHSAFGAVATDVSGRIFVAGGLTNYNLILGAALFDPATQSWSTVPPMRTPRHHFLAVASGERVFAIEGSPTSGTRTTRKVEAIDLPR